MRDWWLPAAGSNRRAPMTRSRRFRLLRASHGSSPCRCSSKTPGDGMGNKLRPLLFILGQRPEAISGLEATCGVMKISSSVLDLDCVVWLKIAPTSGNVAQERDFVDGFGFLILHEAADDDGLSVADGDAGLGLALVDDQHIHVGLNGDGGGGELGDGGGDIEDDQAVGVNVRRDVEDDADLLVSDGVHDGAFGGNVRGGDDGDELADHDGGELIVGGEDGGAGEDIELAGGGQGADGDGEVGLGDGGGEPARVPLRAAALIADCSPLARPMEVPPRVVPGTPAGW